MTSTPSRELPRPSPASGDAGAAGKALVSPWAVMLVGICTLIVLLALDAFEPYAAVNRAFGLGGGGTAVETQTVRTDPATRDPNGGADLLRTHTSRPQP